MRLELLLELGELFQGDLLLLVQDLVDALDFLDLGRSVGMHEAVWGNVYEGR